MEEQKQYTDRFLRTKNIEKYKKKSKLFFLSMLHLSAEIWFSYDFFQINLNFIKVGIFGLMNNIKACAEEIVLKEIIYV